MPFPPAHPHRPLFGGKRPPRRYFDRDVQCIRDYFSKRYGFESDEWPQFSDVKREASLDAVVMASGFSKKKMQEFDELAEEHMGAAPESEEEDDDDDDEEEEEEVGVCYS